MIELDADRIATECGGEVTARGASAFAARATIDSREVAPGDLFFGLRGDSQDGGEHAAAALAAGAWGVVVGPEHARALGPEAGGWVVAAADPLLGLQRVARGWRREIGCPLIGITGSTGKTSVKDITRALLPGRVHASRENFNTEIGLPLTLLAAPRETELLVCEMAMRGMGQIAELCEIAEPDVAAITNVGPVHLELLGTLEAIAEAKAEILSGLRDGGRAVVPAKAEALEPHLSASIDTLTFGPGGDVFVAGVEPAGDGVRATIEAPSGVAEFELPFTEAHNVLNTCCAVAIGEALGFTPGELARRVADISFSRLRGELVQLPAGALLVNDCYNANPISMQAALDHLASLDAPRRIAVLGGMAELGPGGPEYHRDAAAHADELGFEVIGVGELARDYGAERWAPDPETAAELVAEMLEPEDAILVKGSRSVRMERFAEALLERVGKDETT